MTNTAKFCPGCGTYFAANGRHRGDCTADKETSA
jgi:ribosomal protein S27AE